MLLNKTKLAQKKSKDIFTVTRTGVRNRVKIMLNQNKSRITKYLETITSIIVFNSSLTSSIFGRLYRNLI
jgi:hypothetical protein